MLPLDLVGIGRVGRVQGDILLVAPVHGEPEAHVADSEIILGSRRNEHFLDGIGTHITPRIDDGDVRLLVIDGRDAILLWKFILLLRIVRQADGVESGLFESHRAPKASVARRLERDRAVAVHHELGLLDRARCGDVQRHGRARQSVDVARVLFSPRCTPGVIWIRMDLVDLLDFRERVERDGEGIRTLLVVLDEVLYRLLHVDKFVQKGGFTDRALHG